MLSVELHHQLSIVWVNLEELDRVSHLISHRQNISSPTQSHGSGPRALDPELLHLAEDWLSLVEVEHGDQPHSPAAHIHPLSVGVEQHLSIGVVINTDHAVLSYQSQVTSLHIKIVKLEKDLFYA